MKKALVTGCCGFIGSNLVHRLIKDGWDVEGVDDMSNGHMEFLDGLGIRTIHVEMLHLYDNIDDNLLDDDKDVLVIQGDFAHSEILSRVKSGQYDVIFHLAANPRVEYSVKFPVETTETNVLKTVGLFHASIGNVKRVVFSSSSSIYGDTTVIPTPECTAPELVSPYALQKLVGEQYASLFSQLYGLDIVSLRYFNVYGPRQYGNSPYSTAISSWCDCASSGRPLRSDGDGMQTRDMVYVDDVVSANILAAVSNNKNISGKCFNVATGKSYSNNEIMKLFQDNFENVSIQHAPSRPGDVRHTLGDITSIQETLLYKPSTPLGAGLQKTWDWWRLNQ